MARASAPLAFSLGGFWWPYGPDRVEVRAAAGRDGWRCRVEAAGRALWVDPSLPPPVDDEGPLGFEAAALRATPPERPVDLVSRGPRPPRPGAAEAIGLAARAALAGWRGAEPPAPRGALERALAGGRPVSPAGEGPGPTGATAWLDARVVLYDDEVGRAEPGVATDGARLDPRQPDRFREAVAGSGLAGRSEREVDLMSALGAAGLEARWPLGGGVVLGLAAPGRRDRLRSALAEHGLTPLPCRLTGVAGLTRDHGDDEGGPP